MGSKKGGNMMFWTLDEYKKFINCVMDKPLSFMDLKFFTGVVLE